MTGRTYLTAVLLPLAALAPSSTAGADELANGSFQDGMKGWSVSMAPTTMATTEIVPDAWKGLPALEVAVERAGKVTHEVSVSKSGLDVAEGKNYVLSFAAKAEPAGAKIYINVQRAGPDPNLGKGMMLELVPEWQEYRFPFTPKASDANARLVLAHLAQEGRTFHFTDFRLAEDQP